MRYNSNTKKRTATDYIVIHCSATGEQDFGAADIDKWHRKNGWACIGYHYVIRRNGEVEEGRDVQVIGAHVSGHNENSIGICMVGGVDSNDHTKAKNNFTEAQFISLKSLLTVLKLQYPNAKIQGHRDFPGVAKACPSFDVKDWLSKQKI